MLWDHGCSDPWQNPVTCTAKTEQWLVSPGKPRAIDNVHFLMTCQIDVVNKQLVPLLNRNNLFSKTCWWFTYRHVDAKAKYSHMQKNNFVYTLLFNILILCIILTAVPNRWFVLQLKSARYLPLLRFCQKLLSSFPKNLSLELQKYN